MASTPQRSAKPLNAADARRLEECLVGDGVALIPTDTVYGLACNPDSEGALRRIYELKQRPLVKPAAVMFFALKPALETLAGLGARELRAIEALLPGPVTLLLPNRLGRFAPACDPAGAGASGHVDKGWDARAVGRLLGLRVPAFSGPIEALARVRVPAAQSSANLSGGSDPRRLSDVSLELRQGVDLVLDGGELAGSASTVVDLSEYEQAGSWRVERDGPVGRASLERLLG